MESPTSVTPVPPPPTPPPAPVALTRSPRPGHLTPGWRVVTAATWVAAFVAFSGVWKVSRELGLATWWLGPISEPQPILISLIPFAAPSAMVVATLNNSRWLPWFGLAASAACAAVGVGDLDRIRRLAYVELAIAAAGALVSVASLSGMYRSVRHDRPDPADSEGQNGQNGQNGA